MKQRERWKRTCQRPGRGEINGGDSGSALLENGKRKKGEKWCMEGAQRAGLKIPRELTETRGENIWLRRMFINIALASGWYIKCLKFDLPVIFNQLKMNLCKLQLWLTNQCRCRKKCKASLWFMRVKMYTRRQGCITLWAIQDQRSVVMLMPLLMVWCVGNLLNFCECTPLQLFVNANV